VALVRQGCSIRENPLLQEQQSFVHISHCFFSAGTKPFSIANAGVICRVAVIAAKSNHVSWSHSEENCNFSYGRMHCHEADLVGDIRISAFQVSWHNLGSLMLKPGASSIGKVPVPTRIESSSWSTKGR